MNGEIKKDVLAGSQIAVQAHQKVAGKGVFASRPILVGQKIEYFEGYEVDHLTRYSLTCDGILIEPTESLRFLNHSCAPNAFFVERWLETLGAIDAGEEITIDYLATESEVTVGFKCECGSKKCRDWIGNHKKES